MGKFIEMSDALMNYIGKVGVREHAAQARCRAETAAMGRISGMQISPDEGAFLAMLVRLTQTRRYLEIGTFTGYSALSVALALPADGRIDALDVSDEYVGRARAYWQEAGVAEKIITHIAPALETLDLFLKSGRAGAYDFAFIDADKTNYAAYVERCHRLVRKGGLIAIDNTLWSGAVIDPANTSDDTRAIRALNEALAKDARFDIALVAISDGITLLHVR